MKRKAFTLISAIFILVFSYIMILTLNQSSNRVSGWLLIPLLLLLGGILLSALGLESFLDKLNFRPWIPLLGISVIAVVLRLFWMLNVNTVPFSDFAGYINYAMEIAKGNIWHPNDLYELFPFTVGYPLILSVFFIIFGTNLLVVKILNLLCSILLLFLIYAIASRIFDRKAGYMASLFFAVWPTQVMYTSVMSTEHIFIIFFMLSIYLAFLIRKSTDKKKYIFSIILGISIMMTQFVRPIASLLIPAIFIYVFLLVEFKSRPIKNLMQKAAVCTVILTCYMLCSLVLNYTVVNITGVSLTKTSPGFNLLIGTNTKYGGVWNEEDAKIIDEFKGDPEKTQNEALRRSIDRIKSDPVGFIKFALGTKVKNLWADEGYGYFWSTQEVAYKSSFFVFMEKNSYLFYTAYQVFYLFIMVMALIGALFAFWGKCMDTILIILISLLIFGAHLFLEVQGRYAFPAIPLLIILAGYGLNQMRIWWMKAPDTKVGRPIEY